MLIYSCHTETNSRGRELMEHGSAALPAGCYLDDLSQGDVPWHWHDEFEVILVESGTMRVSVGSKRMTVPSGSGLFINSGALHAAEQLGDETCRIPNIVFHPRLVGGSYSSAFWDRYLIPLMGATELGAVELRAGEPWADDALASVERAWRAGAEEPIGYEFVMREELSRVVLAMWELLPKALSDQGAGRRAKRANERMKLMLDLIEQRFAEPLTIDDIAGAASVSTSECLRCFAEVVGITPIQYLRRYRLQRAAALLETTDMTVGEVARSCGFKESSYFARAFKDLKGATPAAYRRAFKEKGGSR